MTEYTEIADPPRQCVIETVLGCQLSCPSCYLGAGKISRKKGLMSWEMFSKIADQIEPFVKHVYAHLWGEPTLHPRLGDMIRRLKKFATVDLSTHGIGITEELAKDMALCDSLSVSIEGLDQQTYELYRVNGDLAQAMEGLRMLAKAKPGKVNWTWVVTSLNEHQLPEAKKLAAEIGVNLNGKSPYFVDEKTKKELMPKSTVFQRYDERGNLKADRHSCHELWETIYFGPSGDSLLCCYNADGKWIPGNINDNTVLEIWNGEAYRAMRRKHLSGTLNEMCLTVCGMP